MRATVQPVTILVAISNRILCEGLCQILRAQQPQYSCFTAFQKTVPNPDLILFDAPRPLAALQSRYPKAKYLLMDTGLKEPEISYLLCYHQVSAVIAPHTSLEMFCKALSVVHGGQIWIENQHLKSLLQGNGVMNKMGHIKALSRQDQQIADMVAMGLKNKEIAARLCLSEHTIKAHLGRIFKTLHIHRRAQLISLVLEGGQILP